MTSTAWNTGDIFSPQAGNYEYAPNWSGFVVPDETAYFGPSYTLQVILNSAISVGSWVVQAYYQFTVAGAASLTFTSDGVTGGGVLLNYGTVTFANTTSAGAMTYVSSGVMNFNDRSTAEYATIVAAATGTVNFTGKATAGDATLVTAADSGHVGRINFTGIGLGNNHSVSAGSISGAGIFNLGDNHLTVGTNSSAETTVTGRIIGSKQASLIFDGNKLTLEGNNTYGGGTTIIGGELIVNGKIGNVRFGDLSTPNFQYGSLEGNGTVGKVNGVFGLISAGEGQYGVGHLTTKDLTLGPLATLTYDVAGTSGHGAGGYDQISVKGAVKLLGGRLNIGMGQVYDTGRHRLVIIDNDGKDHVSGTFRGGLYGPLREGEAFGASSEQIYSISYKGGTGNDVVLRGEGRVVQGSDAGEKISSKIAPNDKTTKYADYIDAWDGDDTVTAGGGNDTVFGGRGKDKLDGGTGNDLLALDDGYDGTFEVTLNGSKFATVKFNGIAEDRVKNFENVEGGDFADKLSGDGRANIILGREGNDVLKGAAGNDVLVGAGGKDKLQGGAGRDKFVFNYGPDPAHADRISDFSHGQDKLVLSASTFDAVGAKLSASELAKGAGLHDARDKNDHIIYDTKSGKLYYDPDGVGGEHAKLFATLTHHGGLLASDFAVIV